MQCSAGRYTYELGKALHASAEKSDNDLWVEWYEWSLKLAVQSSFTEDETEKKMARSFITETFNQVSGIVAHQTVDIKETLHRKHSLSALRYIMHFRIIYWLTILYRFLIIPYYVLVYVHIPY